MALKLNLLLIPIFISTCAVSQTSQDDYSFKAPDSSVNLKKLNLWATQYYIHKFKSGGSIPILDQKGKSLGLFADTCNFCDAALEGTAYVTDSLNNVTIINFAKAGSTTLADCRKCKKYAKSKLAVESWGKALWSKSSGFGDGVKNYKLIPFRTIAVDNKNIPYGTVIYIPKVKGKMIELPNGEKVEHDGYFFAGDTGGAIKKNHVDVFTGIFSGNPFTEVIRSNENKTFDAYIVRDTNIIHQLTVLQTK